MSEMLSPLMMVIAIISILAGLGGGGWMLISGRRKIGPVLAIIGSAWLRKRCLGSTNLIWACKLCS